MKENDFDCLAGSLKAGTIPYRTANVISKLRKSVLVIILKTRFIKSRLLKPIIHEIL